MSQPHAEPQHPALPGGLQLGEPFGIALRLHWSFLLLVGWLALSALGQTGSLAAAAGVTALIGLIFLCVALHEYGHALMARRYGIGTREIMLLPIGGLASLERNPDDPRQEFWIALAGPAVNFALAGVAALGLVLFGGGGDDVVGAGLLSGSLLDIALRVNLVMGIFNLVPALPMDGGRVLRAALATRMPTLRATRIATRVAQVFAGGMMAFGVMRGSLMLAIVGGFVWIAARSEMRRVVVEAMMRERARRGFADPWHAGADPPGEWLQPDGSAPPPPAREVSPKPR